MKRTRSLFAIVIIISVGLTGALSGCGSLAEDITPPPGENPPVEALEETDIPTLEPTSQPAEVIGSGEGFVNVFLVDQTSSGLPVDDLVVRLEGFDSFERVFEQTQPLSGSSMIQFSGVDFPAGRVFFASIAFEGAIYRSEIVQVGEGQENLDLELVVFDTTTDQSALVIDRLHIILEFMDPGSIRVMEIYIISNLGDSTVVPASEGGISVDFHLPDGASGLEFEEGSLGQRFHETRDGFGDTVSIPPGSGVYPLSVTYWLPYQKNKLDFSQQFNLPVGAVVIMTPAGEMKIKGAEVEDMGVQSIPSGEVQIYSTLPIQSGGNLEFRISGKPANGAAPEASGLSTSQLIIYGAGAVGILLLASGIWLFIRNQRQVIDDEKVGPADTKEELLDSIIALDDLFSAGDISEADYQRKRAQLKKRLRSIKEE